MVEHLTFNQVVPGSSPGCLIYLTCYEMKDVKISGCGGIGRRARFRFWWETVGVQVPSPALNTNVKTVRFWRFFYSISNYLRDEKTVKILAVAILALKCLEEKMKRRARQALAIFMRLLLIVLVCKAFTMAGEMSIKAAQTGLVVTTSSTLRVRTEPNGEALGSLMKGAAVTVVGENDGWYKIEFQSGYGYVSKDYIQILEVDNEYREELLAKGFPESFVMPLMKLHQDYPNWEFEAWKTGLDWSEAVEAESKVGKNTISGLAFSSYKSVEKGAYNLKNNSWVSFDSGGWVSASKEIISYYMDPRNFLDAYYIFQFMDQCYDENKQTAQGLTTVVDNTFLNTKYYKNALMKAGKQSGVSPYVLASMIIVEQGYQGTGKSISGNQSGYRGYYNFYNIGAYAVPGMSAVQRGLWYAKGGSIGATSYSRPWNSKEKAIAGGGIYYGENYVKKGQTTLYLKKFNVQGETKYTHQYMTNTQAAASEAFQLAKAYNKITDGIISFKIPLYDNMPVEGIKKPTGSGNPVNYLSELKVDEYKMEPVFKTYTQTYHLIVPSKQDSITIRGRTYSDKATVQGFGIVELKKGMNCVNINVTAENGNVRVYTIYVYRGKEEDANFDVTPIVTPIVTSIVTPSQGVASPTVTQGITPTAGGGNDGTDHMKPSQADINGDGKVSIMDLLKIRKAILGDTILTKEEEQRADLNGNGKVDVVDLLRVQKIILGL